MATTTPLSQRVLLAMEHGGFAEQAALEAAADLSKGYLSRVVNGERKSMNLENAKKVAAACRVSLMWLQDGTGEMASGGPAPPVARVELDPVSPVVPSENASALERAMGDAFDAKKHLVRDIDNVRHALRATFQHQSLEGDLVAAARAWLDAAAHLRVTGQRVDAEGLVRVLTVGLKATPQQRARAEEADAQATAESRARAAANGFTENPEAAARMRAAMASRKRRAEGDE